MWVLDADVVDRGPPIAYLTHRSRPLESFERQLLDAALAGSGSRPLPVDQPMRFRELHLPTQAVVLGQPFDRAILPLYDRIRERLVGDVRPDDRPLHLSRVRARDPLRRTLGEVALDRRLDAAGIRVLHPQELALPDQIRLVASARTVSGLNGSALHLTVLRDLPDARTISIDPRTPFAVQREVDRLRGARFVSLQAQYPLQPRLPGRRTLEVGAHRNFIAPGSTARRLRAMIEG